MKLLISCFYFSLFTSRELSRQIRMPAMGIMRVIRSWIACSRGSSGRGSLGLESAEDKSQSVVLESSATFCNCW